MYLLLAILDQATRGFCHSHGLLPSQLEIDASLPGSTAVLSGEACAFAANSGGGELVGQQLHLSQGYQAREHHDQQGASAKAGRFWLMLSGIRGGRHSPARHRDEM